MNAYITFFVIIANTTTHLNPPPPPSLSFTEVNIVLSSQSILGVATIHDVTLQLTRFHQDVKFSILGYD